MKAVYRLCLICMAVLLCMTGCKSKDSNGQSTLSGIDRDGSPGAEDGITTDFLEDTVFTVADRRVSLAEWYLYSLPQAARAEGMYGDGVFAFEVSPDGTTIAQELKDDVREQITYVKIVSAKAEELGIKLGEDDLFTINLETDEYLSRLTDEQRSKYGIDAETVKQVYADNLLAMKVYENLTLNISTVIPDEQVRFMVLEYIMLMKDYEGENGDFVRYDDSELEELREAAAALVAEAKADSSVTRLSDLESEKFAVTEAIMDYSTLVEKYPVELADTVFSMRQDEILGPFETDEAIFVFDCVQRTEETNTNAARIKIIEARQKELFEREYAVWESAVVIKLNYKIWPELGVK